MGKNLISLVSFLSSTILISCGTEYIHLKEDNIENILFSDNSRGSFFTINGTIGGKLGMPISAAIAESGHFDVIVTNGEGGYIEKIDKNGNSIWRKFLGVSVSASRFLERIGDVVTLRHMGEILFIDTTNGNIIHRYNERDNGFYKNGFILTDTKLFDSSDNLLISNLSWPRDLDSFGNYVGVADTFNQRVILLNLQTHTKKEIKVSYPNSVQFLNSETMLISAEHSNQVLTWNFVKNKIRVVFSCKFFNRVYSLSKINSINVSIDNGDSPNNCSVDVSGRNTLYSLNSARITERNTILIADTDNHRVIEVKNGVVIREIVGFNQPLDVIDL